MDVHAPLLLAAEQMQLSAPARALLDARMPPGAAVQALLDAGHATDALKLLARLLPRRYAVAWCCQCARQVPLDDEDRAGAALAEQWVREPGDDQCRAALDFARRRRCRSVGAWLAAAAGWSGGSLAPTGHDAPVPPPAALGACAVAAAITRLAALGPAAFAVQRAALVRDALGLLETSAATMEA